MLAQRAGDRARWRLVVALEVLKALCRLGMGRASGDRPVIATGVGDDRTERRVDDAPQSADNDGGDDDRGVASDGARDDGGWKMPRTGMRLPPLPSSSPSSSSYAGIGGGGAGAGSDGIRAYLTSRVITADEIKPAPALVRTLDTLPAHLAELLYILRPPLYALALQRYRADKRDWRPWLLGLSMEVAARQLGKADGEGGWRRWSGVERGEAGRRGWALAWWGMRGAFYESVTGGVMRGVAGRLKGKAVLDMVGVVVEDYDYLWSEYYFPTATL